MKRLSSLSIFFPSLNDAQILPELIRKAVAVAKKVSNDFEIIVINDGSTDNTKEVLNELQKKYAMLKVVHHDKNRGYGGALISGFKHSKKEWIFYTDGDGQYDPGELSLLVEKLDNQTDVVNGFKIKRSDAKRRKILGSTYNKILHKIYNIPISDIDCDFRLIRNKCLKQIKLVSNSGMICLELILKLKKINARFKEIEVHHYPRKYGKSQFFKISKLFETLRDHGAFFVREHFPIS